MKPEDLFVRVNGQDRKVFSVSSTASLPKTIGIFIDAYGPGPLSDEAIDAISGFLKASWQEKDVAFVVSFSDKIYEEVAPTSDLAQIANELPKILPLNPERVGHWAPHGKVIMPPLWYDAVSSIPPSPQETQNNEKVYVVMSHFFGGYTPRSGINLVLRQRARIFPLLLVLDGCYDSDYSNPCYLWAEEHTAMSLARKTGGDDFIVEKSKDLARAQTSLVNELRSTYVVTYEASPQSVGSGTVKILCNRANVRLMYPKD